MVWSLVMLADPADDAAHTGGSSATTGEASSLGRLAFLPRSRCRRTPTPAVFRVIHTSCS